MAIFRVIKCNMGLDHNENFKNRVGFQRNQPKKKISMLRMDFTISFNKH